MKKWWWVAGGVVLLAAGAGAYVLLERAPLGEVTELVADDGARELRTPMRPAAAGSRVLIIALDGVGEDELVDAMASGGAPQLAELFGAASGDGVYATGYVAPDVLSILPSTTLAAWASLFTGEPAARTGVPGNEWFVREERRFYAPAPVSVSGMEDLLSTYTDDLVGGALRVPTLYERADVRSFVSLSHIHRGADLLVVPDAEAITEVAARLVTGIGDDGEDPEAEEYAEIDEEGVEIAAAEMRKRGVPALQVVYFPGVDLYTHVAKDPLPMQRRYITDVVDPAVSRLLRVYREQGVLDSTWVVVVSDHGHTPVLDDDRHSLGTGGDDEPTSLIEQAGYRLRPLDADPEAGGDWQAVVAYQGAFAYVYVADRSTCVEPGTECDWSRAPRFDEDVMPLVRAFDAANRTGAGVPELQGTLDMILTRTPVAPPADAAPFGVWDGGTLLGIGEYLARQPRPDLLQFESRMNGLAAGPYGHRAGDILLFARSGADRPIEDRYYFSGNYSSWHGSPSAQDSHIALAIARGGQSGTAIRDVVREAAGDSPTQRSVVDIVLRLLGQ